MGVLEDMLIKVEESVRSGGSSDADLSILLLLWWLELEEDDLELELLYSLL